jgi:hypothetical protein
MIFALMLGLSTGCAQDNSKLAENAAIQGKASSEAQIHNENANLARRVGEMEADLTTRQRFYQGVKGMYEGEIQTEGGIYKIRMTLVPSLPPYDSSRIRTIEEVAADLNNLYLNAHVIQWNPTNNLSAVGCRVGHIRPDIVSGEISIASENCPNLYTLTLTDLSPSRPVASAQELASRMIRGELENVTALQGEMQPSTNAAIYHFQIHRVDH